MRDEFDTGSGSIFRMAEYEGDLVLVYPVEHIEEITTTNGTKDAVSSDIIVLSRGAEKHEGAFVFGGKMIGRLKRNLASGRPVLGRIGKGEAKKGQNAPWVFLDPSEEDKQLARDYLAGRVVAAAVAKTDADDPFAA